MNQLLKINLLACALAAGVVWLLRPAPVSQPLFAIGPLKPVVLDKPIASLDLEKIPLDQALNKLADISGINILADWYILEVDGNHPKNPVTLHLRNSTLRMALASLCQQSWCRNMGYTIEDGVIVVTRRDELAKANLILRTYDIQDLILRMARRDQNRRTQFNGISGPLSYPEESVHRQVDYIDLLVAGLTNYVSPDSWKDAGGFGSCRDFGGYLFIEQTPEVHGQIQLFLETFRRNIATSNQEHIDGLSVIESNEADKACYIYCMYDVQDLILRMARRDQQAAAQRVAAGQTVTQPTRDEMLNGPYIDEIADKIEEKFAPERSRDDTSRRFRVGRIHGFLYISQTPQVHRQIQDFLDNLRRTIK